MYMHIYATPYAYNGQFCWTHHFTQQFSIPEMNAVLNQVLQMDLIPVGVPEGTPAYYAEAADGATCRVDVRNSYVGNCVEITLDYLGAPWQEIGIDVYNRNLQTQLMLVGTALQDHGLSTATTASPDILPP